MKRLALIAVVTLGLACQLRAQDRTNGGFSDTFAFDKTGAITSWDGSDPANPPYPTEMGAVSLQTPFGGGYGSGIEIPFELGYLNNGFLNPCDTIVWDANKVWTIGDGTHVGDSFTQHGSTTCPYFTGEWGTYNNSNNRLDGFSVDAVYVMSQKRVCVRGYHGTCFQYRYFLGGDLTGGTGTATDTIINQPSARLLYLCGSKRKPCFKG